MRLVPVRRDGSFEDMFQMMDEFFSTNMTKQKTEIGFRLDIIEEDDSYIVVGELPGVKREEIKLDYENNLLKIGVEKTEDEDKNYVHREINPSSMERVLRFKKVESDRIQAKLEDGLLIITLPKTVEEDQKKSIQIQ